MVRRRRRHPDRHRRRTAAEAGRVSLTLLLVCVTLAAYRTWRPLAVDKWPPIADARARLKQRWWGLNADGSLREGWTLERSARGHAWAEGLTCPWCFGSIVAGAYVAGV